MYDGSLKSWALRYADRGFAVFPCQPNSKKALPGFRFDGVASSDGLHPTTDPKQIEKWWSENPGYNIGIATGSVSRGLVVIDVDMNPAKNKVGEGSLHSWEADHGDLPATCSVRSGSGGRHYYYISSDQYGTTQGILPDIDLMAERGKILAPPSIHPDTGQAYEWIDGQSLLDVAPTMLSGSARDLITSARRQTHKHQDTPERFTAGTRTRELVRMIGKSRSLGMNDDEIREAIKAVNTNRCDPPLTDRELEQEVFPSLKRDWLEDHSLDQFHTIDSKGNALGVYDNEIFTHICENHHLFVIGSIPYIYEGGVFRPDENGTRLKTMIKRCIYPRFIRSSTIDRVYKLFTMDHALQEATETVNSYPCHWINFTNGFYDPIEKKMIAHSPKYKAVNQIPHEYHPEAVTTGNEVDRWLDFIAPDPGDREMLLQFCGYCMTRDIRQQKFLILVGSGGSGKSTLIRLLSEVVGSDNISSISLKELTQRFASYGLMGKLLNCCADLEVSALEDVSMLKKILGEDYLRGEPKGKDAVTFRNYAKLIFSTNELPLVLSERTNGFYRRLMVLSMDMQPPIVRPDFFDILKADLAHFIHLAVEALEQMYESGTIAESVNSSEAVNRLRQESDTVEAWLADNCYLEGRENRSYLLENYQDYCIKADRTPLKKHQFFRSLRSKRFVEVKSSGAWFFQGVTVHNFHEK